MGRSRWVDRCRALGLALAGLCCCSASSSALRIDQAGAERGRPLAFETLAAYSIPAQRLRSFPGYEELRESRRASDRTSLSAAWQSFQLPGAAPSLDFSREEVLFVATRESATCGVLPLTAVEGAPPALILRTPASGSQMCPRLAWKLFLYADIEAEPSLVVRVVAVQRQREPARVLRFGEDAASSRARGTLSEPTAARGATVNLPPPGGVTLTELDDGSKVWVLQHQDGGLTALAGDFPPPLAAVGAPLGARPAAFVPAVWQPKARCFNSLFDELGRPTFRALPPLDRYELTRDPASSERLRIGRRLPGEPGRMAERRCVPLDDRVYNAYPRPPAAPKDFVMVGGHSSGPAHAVALGVEFPLYSVIGAPRASHE